MATKPKTEKPAETPKPKTETGADQRQPARPGLRVRTAKQGDRPVARYVRGGYAFGPEPRFIDALDLTEAKRRVILEDPLLEAEVIEG
ncbi:MAG: hypothetical protein AAGH15_09470 [Myxococcota bacterium]